MRVIDLLVEEKQQKYYQSRLFFRSATQNMKSGNFIQMVRDKSNNHRYAKEFRDVFPDEITN